MWKNADTGPFDPNDDDKAKNDRRVAVPCRICENAFRRLRLTLRYCMQCKRGFCDGEHGNLAPGHGRCIQCAPHA